MLYHWPLAVAAAVFAFSAGAAGAGTALVEPQPFPKIGVVRYVADAGETNRVSITLTFDPRVPVETMTAYIVQISMGDTPTGTLEYRSIYVVGASLFVITFAVNLISQRLSRWYRMGISA